MLSNVLHAVKNRLEKHWQGQLIKMDFCIKH